MPKKRKPPEPQPHRDVSSPATDEEVAELEDFARRGQRVEAAVKALHTRTSRSRPRRRMTTNPIHEDDLADAEAAFDAFNQREREQEHGR